MEYRRDTYQVDVEVKQLKVEIRFPCQITYSVKIDQQEFQSNENVKLQNYLVQFKNKVSIRGDIDWNQQYVEKIGVIIVYVLSGNRKNIAGTLEFDIGKMLNQTQSNQTMQTKLQRCLDKNSNISLNVRVRAIQKAQPKTKRVDLLATPRSSRQKQNMTSSQIQSRLNSLVSKHLRSITNSGQKNEGNRLNLNNLSKSRQDRSSSFYQNSPRDKEKRITRLQIQKTTYIKQITSLKTQLIALNSELLLTNQKLQQSLQTVKNKDAEIQFLSSSLEQKTNQLTDLQQKIYELINVNEELERMYLQSKQQLQLYQGQEGIPNQALEEQINVLMKMNEQLEQRLNKQIFNNKGIVDSLTQEAHYYRDILKEQQDNNTTLNKDIKTMNESLKQKQIQCSQLIHVLNQQQVNVVSPFEQSHNIQNNNKINELQNQIVNYESTFEMYKVLLKQQNDKVNKQIQQLHELQQNNMRLSLQVQRNNKPSDKLSKVYSNESSLKDSVSSTFENSERDQLLKQISYLSEELRNSNQEIIVLKQNKESIRKANNLFGTKLQEQQNNYHELRLKYKNMEFQASNLRRVNSVTQVSNEENQRFRQRIVDTLKRYYDTLLTDEPFPIDPNCKITTLLGETKIKVKTFIVSLQQQYQTLINQLQRKVNSQQTLNNVEYKSITQQLKRIQSENSYQNQVVGVREQILSKQSTILREQLNQMRVQINNISSDRNEIIDRLNQQILNNQNLISKIQDAQRYIEGIQQDRNNLSFELERQTNLLSQQYVVSDNLNKNSHIDNLNHQLNIERNRIVQLLQTNKQLQNQLNQALSAVHNLQFRSLDYKHKLESLEQEHRGVLDRQDVLNGILKDYQYKDHIVQKNTGSVAQQQMSKMRQSVRILSAQLQKQRGKRKSLNSQLLSISTSPLNCTNNSNVEDLRRQLQNTQIRYQAKINELLQQNITNERSLNNLKANLIADKQQFIESRQLQMQDLKNKIKLCDISAEEKIRKNNYLKNQQISCLKYELLVFKQEHRKASRLAPQLNLQFKQEFIKEVTTLQQKIDDISHLLKSMESCVPFLILKFKDMHLTFQNLQLDNHHHLVNSDFCDKTSGVRKTVRQAQYKFEKIQEISSYLTTSIQKILILNDQVQKLSCSKAVSIFKVKELQNYVDGRQYEQLRRAIQQIVAN